MIIIQVPNSRPQSEIGQAVAQDVVLKSIPKEPLTDFCLCQLGIRECEYTEMAFYGGSNELENDYTSLFVNKEDSTDVIELVLINLTDNSEIILNDSNASEYGFYVETDKYVGAYIDFDTLKTNFNTLTRIKFKVKQTVFGVDLEETTHVFSLTKWNKERADGTIRIETVNKGFIESGANYEDLSWKKSIRLKGEFAYSGFPLTTDDYLDGERVYKQIIDSVEVEYKLESELNPSTIFKSILLNDVLANEMYISDYNILNTNHKRVAVKPTNIDFTRFAETQKGSFEITFTDRQQNNRKRNY